MHSQSRKWVKFSVLLIRRVKIYLNSMTNHMYITEETKSETLDLSRRGLKKIEKAPAEDSKTIINLVLDQNELQRLDNIETYNRVENVSIIPPVTFFQTQFFCLYFNGSSLFTLLICMLSCLCISNILLVGKSNCKFDM